MAGAEGRGLRGGGLGLLVLGLAVDDARHRFAGILPDPLPDAHHVAAGGVHQHAALGLEFLSRLNLRAERRNDHHVVRLELVHLGRAGLGRDGYNAHVANLVVDLGVVDDLAEQIDGAGRRKHAARGVGQIDGALDAVAEAEFLGQLDRQAPGSGEHAAVDANPGDQFAPIMRDDLGLYGLHDIRSSEIDFLWRRGRVG